MTAEKLLYAMNGIDDGILKKALEPKRARRHYIGRIAAAAAAVMIIAAGSLPVGTALGADSAYDILYEISPAFAQTFKPVNEKCSYDGIEMCLISANVQGCRASFFISIEDTVGDRINGTADLDDSYYLRCPFDHSSCCTFKSYDSTNGKAYFLVSFERLDGKDIDSDKVTLGINGILCGNKDTEGVLIADLTDTDTCPETMIGAENVSGISYSNKEPDTDTMRFLKTSDKQLCSICDYADVTAIGYFDGALHILTRYKDSNSCDSHGFITLHGKDGSVYDNDGICTVSYFTDQYTDSYDETIIPIGYDKLGNYSLYGEFCSSETNIKGRWQVTAKL